MGLAQFGRLFGLATASLALAAVAIWFAAGADMHAAMGRYTGNDTLYVAFTTDKAAEAARIQRQLTDAGHPVMDSVAAGIFYSHTVIVLEPFDQSNYLAAGYKLAKVAGDKNWGVDTMRGLLFPAEMSRGKYSFSGMFVMSLADISASAARALLLVFALSAGAAGLLALLLLARGAPPDALLWLGMGLGSWSLSVSYLWLYSVSPVFSAYQPATVWLRLTLDVAAFLLALLACHAYIRFWRGFPQPVTDAELDGFLAALKEQQLAKTGLSPRRWLRLFRGRAAQRDDGLAQTVGPRSPAAGGPRWFWPALVLLTSVCTGLSWTGVFFTLTHSSFFALPALLLDTFVYVLLVYWPGITCLRVFRYHRALGSAEDYRKIEWIWVSIWLGFMAVLVPCMVLAVISVVDYFAPVFLDFEDMAVAFLIFGLSAGPLFVILAVAVSILYRGSIDPRLALRGLTLWWFLGVVLTLLFVLVERSIAVKLAAWWHLSPQTGYVTAGAVVAATFQPLRKRVDVYVNRFVERVLPTTLLASGTRHFRAVAVVDISGYTALTAKDEQAALLASALLQKEARRLAEQGGGRCVKSTGDGALLCFEDAGKALDAVAGLHGAVRGGAATLGLPGIVLHSGLHWGEVMEMRDGDIYGMTVNLAARLADWAQAGEIGVSRSFHEQLKSATREFQDAGPQRFKNVPEPIGCLRLSAV